MSRKEEWDGNIESARESAESKLSEAGYDGNREYPNGTYGQSDYTVRERKDGTYDVYVKNDDGDHSHDRIDKDGNILGSYHDYLVEKLSELDDETLDYISSKSNSECVLEIIAMLKQSETKCLNLKNVR